METTWPEKLNVTFFENIVDCVKMNMEATRMDPIAL